MPGSIDGIVYKIWKATKTIFHLHVNFWWRRLSLPVRFRFPRSGFVMIAMRYTKTARITHVTVNCAMTRPLGFCVRCLQVRHLAFGPL